MWRNFAQLILQDSRGPAPDDGGPAADAPNAAIFGASPAGRPSLVIQLGTAAGEPRPRGRLHHTGLL